MKSWERAAAIIVTCLALAGAVQAAFRIPFQIEQMQKENAELRLEFNAEKLRSAEAREAIIRMEERLKAIQTTVEASDRYLKSKLQ